MRKRRALVGILLVLFLGALNVFLYAQPSIEELTGRIESLEKTIGELKKSSAEKDDIISFLKEQQSSVYQNANIALESVDKAIANLTVNVDRLSDLMTAVVLLIGVAFPIVTFFIQSKLDKKRIEGVEDKLVDVNEQAKALETRLSIKLEEAREQLSAEVNRAIGYSLEAKQWAAESKTSELLSKAHASKELDKKIELFTQIIGIDSENSAAFENRATAYSQKERYDKAVEDYRKALELDPKNVDICNNLANTLRIIKELGEAKEYAQAAIDLDPAYPWGYGTLAEVYSDLDEGDKFYEFLERALEKEYPLLEVLSDDKECRPLYAKHKDEERFKELMKKYNIVIPDDVWK